MESKYLIESDISVVEYDNSEEITRMKSYELGIWEDEEKRIINENNFACWFKMVNSLTYSNGMFQDGDTRVNPERIRQCIWNFLQNFGISRGVDRFVTRLFNVVTLASTIDGFRVKEDILPFANGDYVISERTFYQSKKSSVPYRFPVRFTIETRKTPTFNKWVRDLFTDEDIRTFQEYLGYCLVPTTKAQKALFLVGEGGSGKSRIGTILESMIGDAMIAVSDYKEFIDSKFKLAELENALVLYDDDLSNEALSNTGVYKKLITNEMNITVERKYGQPFKIRPFTRFVSSANEMLISSYDNSSGFYRRLLPIIVKPKSPDFVPDPSFSDKLKEEAEGIVQWAVMGLHRLIENNWQFTISQRTIEYLGHKQSAGNHIPDFVEACLERSEGASVTSAKLYEVYKNWCEQNAIDAWSQRRLSSWMIDNAERYGLRYSPNLFQQNNKRLRGFQGICIKDEWTSPMFNT